LLPQGRKGYDRFAGEGVAQLCQVAQIQRSADGVVYRCPPFVLRHLRKGTQRHICKAVKGVG
jgi:hypothetical protein